MKLTALIFACVLLLTLASQAQTPSEPAAPAANSAPAANPPATANTEKPKPAIAPKPKPAVKLPEPKSLIVEDLAPGKGKLATKGKWIKVNYTGWLYDPSAPMGRGRQIDSTEEKEPFSFKLGAGEMIKGWEDGFNNMKVGGKRRLVIPSEFAYGARGAGEGIVPPNQTLLYEVELVDVTDAAN